MRNFLKVLLLGTVLVSTNVVLAQSAGDAWQAREDRRRNEPSGVSTKLVFNDADISLWNWSGTTSYSAIVSDGGNGYEAGGVYVSNGGVGRWTKVGDVIHGNNQQLTIREVPGVQVGGNSPRAATLRNGGEITSNKSIQQAIWANNNAVSMGKATQDLTDMGFVGGNTGWSV